jgi:hypothetical protein
MENILQESTYIAVRMRPIFLGFSETLTLSDS